MVNPGSFVLYDGIIPALRAGDYELQSSHTLASGQASGLDTETLNTRIRITAPRYKLPPDQALSAWPPANSEGAYESRLPQIVLKNRALPWERHPLRSGDPVPEEPVDENTPWLALVVIAEGEGEISQEVPVAECVTSGVAMEGQADVVKGIYLAVPESTVRKVFPTVPDLRLLAHVREVNKDDTENAMGDDDGFMSVILANRLPQYDREECRPVRYVACLINLEGQLHVLPEPTPPTPTFFAMAYVFDAALEVQIATGDPDILFMGGNPAVDFEADPDLPSVPAGTRRSSGAGRTNGAAGEAGAGPAAGQKRLQPGTNPRSTVKRASPGRAGQWKSTTRQIANTAITTNSADAAFAVRDAMKAGFRLNFEPYIPEKTYRFPVLAHWSFTCTGAGSLDTILQELDVGLLGTLPGPGAKPSRPECLPEVTGDAPPDAPLLRPAPEVAETGHVGLPHVTRFGESRRAWYRGPFTPHATKRNALEDVSGTVLAHVSDQLRATVPDGREDLSLAIAFEIGRLLALSRPSVMAAMMRWRREQFGAARSKGLAGRAFEGSFLGRLGLDDLRPVDIGRLAGRGFIEAAAKTPEKVLGRIRPIADPGRPIPVLDGDPVARMGRGLGIGAEVLKKLHAFKDPSIL